jgi:CO/xanthine dehydrogenase FAD-binding subunit
VSYVSAATLEQALEALAAGARPVAGGSDLVVAARQGKAPLPGSLVAIDRLAELRGIDAGGDGVRIGALVRHADIEASEILRRPGFAALADGSALIGSPATRNVGTLGGNVMNASPAMDTGPGLVVLAANVELRSRGGGARTVPIEELWSGPGRTVAGPEELCVAISIPRPHERAASAYVRLEYRRAMEIAVVGAAASVTLGADGLIEACRIALAAVAPTVIRAPGAERALTGAEPTEDVLAAVAAAASADARPISDIRGSDRYRRHTVGVMARRAVEFALRRAQGEELTIPCNRAHRIGVAA